jgi:CMP/dCMP kinase
MSERISVATQVVTIDGPAGAGKSTTARELAARLGYSFLDTGALYRAVALAARRRGVEWDNGPALGALASGLHLAFAPSASGNRVLVDGGDVTSEIRHPEISQGASKVSAHPEVRAALLGLQQAIGAQGRVVAEGRDTGTVVFPTAFAKFFLTASAEERARRRARELEAQGRSVNLAEVLAELEQRDARDSGRAVAPLRRADDAIEIVTDGMGPDEVVGRMERLVRDKGG